MGELGAGLAGPGAGGALFVGALGFAGACWVCAGEESALRRSAAEVTMRIVRMEAILVPARDQERCAPLPGMWCEDRLARPPVTERRDGIGDAPALVTRSLMIKLDNIYKRFGPKVVLEGFSLEVNEGDAMMIIGYSGTGKSVAIKHIVGLLIPDKGTVFVDDEEVPKLPRRDLYALRGKIGYVFQFAALFDSMSIGENVAMGLRRQGRLSGPEIDKRVAEALELVDLPDEQKLFPAELSGGMRKRVGIARAIALRPKYILYDEPTTGLDPVTSAVIDELMIRMRKQLGVTSVVITHDMRSAYQVGTKIAMLYEGRVRQVGTVDEIRNTKDPVVRQFIEGRATLDTDSMRSLSRH